MPSFKIELNLSSAFEALSAECFQYEKADGFFVALV